MEFFKDAPRSNLFFLFNFTNYISSFRGFRVRV